MSSLHPTVQEEVTEPHATLWCEPNERASRLSTRSVGGSEVTLQDYGSLGEIIGAIATVLTLAYLAFQIRQNNRLLDASVAQAHVESDNTLSLLLAYEQDVARIWYAGTRDRAGLSEPDRQRFDPLIKVCFNNNINDQAYGTLREEELRWLVAQRGVRDWWLEYGALFPIEFQALVEQFSGGELAGARHDAASDSA